MSAAVDLRARVGEALRAHLPREVPMFGATAFMVADRMVVAVRGDGSLLVRIDPDESQTMRTEPGAGPAVMGAGRPMGPGWLAVQPEALAHDDLDVWIERALRFHARTV